MKVLLVGSGGREHALAWKLAQASGVTALHAAPGNPGIAALGDCHPVRADDAEALLGLARSLDTDLAVIGPEAPLVAGVADALRRNGVSVFGPSRAAARIEGSKSFAKDVMAAAGVPTAETLSVARPPCVVKVDGLAAGKGVFICETSAQLDEGLRAASAFDGPIVIEELLSGDEISVFALSDGQRVVPLAPAQDFKRIGDGDTGPNTGGMGSYSPVPGFGPAEVAELVEQIHRPVIEELARRGAPFVGVLFAGLMLTESGPKVLEFNARFGDPETQSIVPRLEGDLLGALSAAAGGDLEGVELAVSEAGSGDRRPRRRRLSGASRFRHADRRNRGRGGGRRARLPRRNGAARRPPGHERRPHPRCHRHRRDRGGGPRARLRRLRSDPVRGHAVPARHRARRDRRAGLIAAVDRPSLTLDSLE